MKYEVRKNLHSYYLIYTSYFAFFCTVKRLRPWARRRAMTLRPFLVAVRARKPCTRRRRRQRNLPSIEPGEGTEYPERASRLSLREERLKNERLPAFPHSFFPLHSAAHVFAPKTRFRLTCSHSPDGGNVRSHRAGVRRCRLPVRNPKEPRYQPLPGAHVF